nr:hypothetical protein [Gammaproteobacteria bacterium]
MATTPNHGHSKITIAPFKKMLLPLAIAATLSACVSGGAGVSAGGGAQGAQGASLSSSGNSATNLSPFTVPTSTTTPITGSTIPLSQATLIPGAGTGQTYYVSTTGSDS